MKRIAIIGSGGSGKSTFSQKLSKIVDIPVYHLDTLFWKPGWVETPKHEWEKIQSELVKKEKWIIDGNYSGSMDIRLLASDTILFFDLPRLVCMYRVFKRIFLYYNKNRPDMGAECYERISLKFLRWIWSYPKTRKPKISKKLEQLKENKNVIILQSQKEIDAFLKSCSNHDQIYN